MKKFLNKFIIILLFAIACIFFANSNVHASFDFVYNDTNYSFPDLPTTDFSDYVITNSKYGYIFVIFFNSSDTFVYNTSSDGGTLEFYVRNCSWFEYKSSSNSWIDKGSLPTGVIGYPIYSTQDVYSDSSKSSVYYSSNVTSSEGGTSERGTDNIDNSNTTGNTTGDGETSESDNTSWLDTLWNWFINLSDQIGDISNSVGEKISDIFSPLWDFITNILSWLNPFSENFILLKLWEFLSDILSYLNPFSDNFFGNILVEKIGTLLKNIFIPDEDYFSNKIADLKSNLNNKIGYQDYIDTLQNIENVQESNIGDIYLNNYKINGVEISSKFINFENILKYRNLWFGIVRGIFYISLLIFDINYIYKLIRGNKLFESGE